MMTKLSGSKQVLERRSGLPAGNHSNSMYGELRKVLPAGSSTNANRGSRSRKLERRAGSQLVLGGRFGVLDLISPFLLDYSTALQFLGCWA
jgi:hypothetical protein